MQAEMPKLRQRQRHEREELVVAEAERLIVEAGYANLVMERLAERVGVAKGTLYLTFPTKEDLLAAIIGREMERFNTQVLAICQRSDLPDRERLLLAASAMREGHSSWARILQGAETAEVHQALARHTELGEGYGRIVRCVADLIGEGQRAGDFSPDIAPVAAAVAVLGLMQTDTRLSPMLPRNFRPGPLDLLNVLFTGLLPPVAR